MLPSHIYLYFEAILQYKDKNKSRESSERTPFVDCCYSHYYFYNCYSCYTLFGSNKKCKHVIMILFYYTEVPALVDYLNKGEMYRGRTV